MPIDSKTFVSCAAMCGWGGMLLLSVLAFDRVFLVCITVASYS